MSSIFVTRHIRWHLELQTQRWGLHLARLVNGGAIHVMHVWSFFFSIPLSHAPIFAPRDAGGLGPLGR